MSEFSSANKDAGLFRNAAKQLIKRTSDRYCHQRLASMLMKVQKSDTINPRGSRTTKDGDISILRGFQFNGKPLSGSFSASYKTLVIRDTGKLAVEIQDFNPGKFIFNSACSTHFQLHVVGMAIDFHTRNFNVDMKSTVHYRCSSTIFPFTILETSVHPYSSGHLFLLFGIEFFVETNGVFYELNNRVDNALVVADVSEP